MMPTIDVIDKIIESITDEEHQKLFDRWSGEYKKRIYGNRESPLPKEHSRYPGFEKNFNALLFGALNGHDPHCEWPYASWIDGSLEKVDVHSFINKDEVWFELGMYTDGDKEKYEKDFAKLLKIVENGSRNIIGILIHFEVFKIGRVFSIFRELEQAHKNNYLIDSNKFDVNGCLVACRLSIRKRITEPQL